MKQKMNDISIKTTKKRENQKKSSKKNLLELNSNTLEPQLTLLTTTL
jgi:hypothetical protein